MKTKVIVIGGGAAGLMAAGTAASIGFEVTLLEKKERVGRKLAISGKGRCNITNDADIETIIANTPGNGNFLYSTLYSYSNADIMAFFEAQGVPLKVERGGRVFPVSDNAKDVVDALRNFATKNGAKILEDTPVKRILTNVAASAASNSDAGAVSGVELVNGKKLFADKVIIATGGASYTGTGSTGDGYRFAREVGHTVTPLMPSLVPLVSNTTWVRELQGLSLKNVAVVFRAGKKKIYSDFGEMLFTHFGVSGPLVLSASRHLLDYDYSGIEMFIDLKPALDEKKLDERILRDFSKIQNRQFCNALDELLPQKLVPVVIALSGIAPEKKVNSITKEERRTIVGLLKNLSFSIDGARPLVEAIVTAGGVETDEINPSTMESKLVPGLYFAGEVIDVDAYTGGFNLTIALSTGHTAGQIRGQTQIGDGFK
ncbi:MAG: NAD(P)/FAD-dependent oxidoreductase [Bacillota bacterium]